MIFTVFMIVVILVFLPLLLMALGSILGSVFIMIINLPRMLLVMVYTIYGLFHWILGVGFTFTPWIILSNKGINQDTLFSTLVTFPLGIYALGVSMGFFRDRLKGDKFFEWLLDRPFFRWRE